MCVLPSPGARHLLLWEVLVKNRDISRVFKQLTVAASAAVDPGDGDVEVPLLGVVAELETRGQQPRVRFAVVQFRYQSVENVAEKIQHDRKGWEPAEQDYQPVELSIAARPGIHLGLIVHVE